MRLKLSLLVVLLLWGCSQGAKPATLSVIGDGVTVEQGGEETNVSISYPECLVPSEKQRTVTVKASAGSSGLASGIFGVVLDLAATVLKLVI